MSGQREDGRQKVPLTAQQRNPCNVQGNLLDKDAAQRKPPMGPVGWAERTTKVLRLPRGKATGAAAEQTGGSPTE